MSEPESEWQALRDENDSLRQECIELREDLKADRKHHDDFLNEVGSLLPPSYDADDTMESIIIHFLTDMQSLAQIITKLTADYR
jgi:hypothetical protein